MSDTEFRVTRHLDDIQVASGVFSMFLDFDDARRLVDQLTKALGADDE